MRVMTVMKYPLNSAAHQHAQKKSRAAVTMHILEDSSAKMVMLIPTPSTSKHVTSSRCTSFIHVLCMQLQMRDVSGQLESRVQLLNIKSSSKVNWVSLAVAHRMAGNHELAWQVRSCMACKSSLRLSRCSGLIIDWGTWCL